MQPGSKNVDSKLISAFTVPRPPVHSSSKFTAAVSRNDRVVYAQKKSITMSALENSVADKSGGSMVPAPQVGALALRQQPQYNMIKMPSGNRMLFKKVEAEP